MAFEKGNKEGKGRKEGSENKVTKQAREIFLDTLEGQSANVNQAFEDLLKNDDKQKGAKEFLEQFAKYAQYFVPKKTENSHDHKGNVTQNIINLGNGTDPSKPTT